MDQASNRAPELNPDFRSSILIELVTIMPFAALAALLWRIWIGGFDRAGLIFAVTAVALTAVASVFANLFHRQQAAAILFLGTLFYFAISSAVELGGVRAVGFVSIILLPAMWLGLLGPRHGKKVAAITALTLLILVWFDLAGKLSPLPDSPRSQIQAIGGMYVFLCYIAYRFGVAYESAVKELEHSRAVFTALITHDLRNPIHAISLQAQLYRRKAGSQDTVAINRTDLDLILRNTNRLRTLVADLLDIARLQTGQLSLSRGEIDLKDEASKTLTDIKPTLGSHPLSFTASGDSFSAWVDPIRLQQIIVNLVTNAAKFSPESKPIEVSLTANSRGYLLTVKDYGQGIAKDDLSRLFERFFRAAPAREKQEGTGLGLYITKGLVEAHGGKIWAESELGKGSIFYVLFPAALAERSGLKAA